MAGTIPSRNIRIKAIASVAALALFATACGGLANDRGKLHITNNYYNYQPNNELVVQLPNIENTPTSYSTPTQAVLPTATPETTLEAIVSTVNLLPDPSFSNGGIGWDLRPAIGNDGDNLGVIDTEVYHTAPASLKMPAIKNVSDAKELVRAVWPQDAIHLGDKTDIMEGDVLTYEGYVRLGPHSDDPSVFWVNPKYAGSLDPYPGIDEAGYKVWMDRGGARLGLDFYNAEGKIISTVRGIADWTLGSDEWYKVSVCADVVKDASYVVPWLQVFEADVPTNVWADDLSLSVIRFR